VRLVDSLIPFRVLRFLLVGSSATLLHYAIMAILVSLSVPPTTASACGYALSSIYNYVLNSRFTFVGRHNHAISAPRFALTSFSGLGINQLVLMAGLTLTLPLTISQLAATGTVLVWNYLIHANWTFTQRANNK